MNEANKTLDAMHFTNSFSPSNDASFVVHSSEVFSVLTRCASGKALTRSVRGSEGQTFLDITGWDRTQPMPMTGPIFVDGADEGSIIAIDILEIRLEHEGWTKAESGRGVFGDKVQHPEVRISTVVQGGIQFEDDIRIPVEPMIGSIGTSPKYGSINPGVPGTHGGNMDCKLVAPGCTLFLPVYTSGALLGLGDVHAAMGDGEVGACGLEIGAEVIMRVRLTQDNILPLPFVANSKLVATIASRETLDDAAISAAQAMITWIVNSTTLDLNSASMLVSMAGNLKICQIVNSLKTCRMEMPLEIIQSLPQDGVHGSAFLLP
jgi:amidase